MNEFDAHGLLTGDAINDRLRILSSTVVEDIYKLAQQQVKDEEARAARLDGKASTMVSSTNLSLTVAFTFGASVLSQHPAAFQGVAMLAAALVVVAVIAGLTSSVAGLLALRTGKSLVILNEAAVFERVLLDQTTELMVGGTSDELKAQEAAAAALYRRTLTEHLWQVSQRNHVSNQQRARLIAVGHIAFLLFLFSLVALGSTVAFVAAATQ